MLKCETNTEKMRWIIYDAARATLNNNFVTTHFEHGQWWITDPNSGAQWSVCDSEDGFSFEQVTEGEEG